MSRSPSERMKFSLAPLSLALAGIVLMTSCGEPESGSGQQSSSASGKRHNVVFISLDSVRQDRLGIYGHKPEYAPNVAVTPNIDRLATEGVVFDECWATSSWTLPSHMAAMTGLSDAAHGVVHDHIKLDPKRGTLAQHFQNAGYATAGFFSGPYLDAKYGFGKGFDYYASGMISEAELAGVLSKASQEKAAQGGSPTLSEMEMIAIRDRVSHEDITSPRINELGMEFLDMHGEQPFFLFLHYFDAHYDHIPEKMEPGLGKKFDPNYSGNFSPDRWYFNPEVREVDAQNNRNARKINERDLGHIQAYYDAEIHWVDRHVGQVVKRLKELGVYENTIIAIVADHGDEFFEHGSIGHRGSLWTEVCKIPLILKLPNSPAPGKRVAQVVRMYDIAPSLADFAGLTAMPDVQGTSIRSLLNSSTAASRDMISNLSSVMPASPGQWYGRTQEAWRDERYTILRMLQCKPFADRTDKFPTFSQVVAFRKVGGQGGSPFMFFDRQTDPMERTPLPLTHPAFDTALNRFVKESRRLQQSQAALSQSHPSERWAQAKTEEEIRTLIAMGYMEESEAKNQAKVHLPAFAPYPVPLKTGF